jgi:hypothetical protein
MYKTLKRNLFPTIIALSALSVSLSAAFYSVSGLSKLFAGASLEVIIMAGSLEVAKLVIASLLYQYWDTLNKYLRTYLTVATVVLILITSMGIYGFLSAAYQDTYRQLTVKENQTAFLEQKKLFYENDVNRYDEELKRISSNITTLSNARSQSIQVRDTSVAGGVRTTISTSELRMAAKRIEVEEENRKNVQRKREVVADSLQNYQLAILELDNNTEVAGELGPLQYLSGLTGTPMDKIINILLLIIIFVFDPLAIALVVAANFAFDKARPKKNLYDEVEDDWDEFIKEETYEARADNTGEFNDESESRMNIIGQNGNDGLHYGEEEWDEDHALDLVMNDMVKDLTEEDIKGIEVKEPEVILSQQALKDKIKKAEVPFIIKKLQENTRQIQVLYSDGSTAWIRKKDNNPDKILYM